MRTTAGAAALLALALGLAACGGGEPAGDGAPAGDDASAATLRTGDSDLGEIVVDAQGRTVYVFDADEPGSGESSCSGECLGNWPPVVPGDGEPTADGVDGELATIERDDGTLQVTLDGSPLYLFAGDAEPGDVAGQALEDVWWVVGPDGQKITETAESSPEPEPDYSY